MRWRSRWSKNSDHGGLRRVSKRENESATIAKLNPDNRNTMPRSAEDILEFGRLREIVCGFNTCAPGRREIGALAFSQDRAKLDAQFALIREAKEWLRGGNDLGFGSLADPDPWLTRLAPDASDVAASGAVLAPGELLDAASLLNTSAWLHPHFYEARESFPG